MRNTWSQWSRAHRWGYLIAPLTLIVAAAGVSVAGPTTTDLVLSVAAYTAAAIARASPLATRFQTWCLATGGSIVAFCSIHESGMMPVGPWNEILMAMRNNSVGLSLVAAGFVGYAARAALAPVAQLDVLPRRVRRFRPHVR